jgi:nucleoside-diphosphate-sugar epimerase
MSGLTHQSTHPKTPQRVVVIGSRGFVGGAIVAELAKAAIPALPLSSEKLDLLASGADTALAALLRPEDAVVIVSALTPDRGKDVATFMKNLRMMEQICAALQATPAVHVVNIGSDAVYADEPSLVDEATPVTPAGFHGMMHAARETMLHAVVPANLALLRPSLLYGATDTHNGYGPNRFRRTAQSDGKITLFGNGEEKRDHVAIDDVATIVRLVLQHRSVGILNVATGSSASFREAAELVAARFDKPVEIIPQKRGGPITHRHFATGALLRAFPDFRPTALDVGIAAAHRRAAAG